MSSKQFQTILSTLKTESIFVIDASIAKSDYVPLDLSVHNAELKALNVSSSADLSQYVNQIIKSQNGKVACGGYLETRGIYNRSSHFNEQTDPADERNIHLGMDIWVVAGTHALSALDGEIHGFKNNLNYGDYGPTIIVKHTINDFSFYTLYGHLSVESLSNIKVGDNVKQGESIGTLGSVEVNGDYPPHLHFQIILNIEDYKGDYPGVASINTIDFYKQNCPDPNLLLGVRE